MADKIRESGVMEEVAPATGPAKAERRASKPQTHRAQQKAITQGLRRFFDSVASEPVPDEFLAILQKIDGKKEADA
jgi:Anti-sigma factor NepR